MTGPTFGDVLAAPDDLGLRAVWADALQLAGDPRGEFVALQLAPRSYTSWIRQRELEMQHGRRWAGPLEKYFSSLIFEGGVLVGGRLQGLEAPACVEPEWRLISTLEHGRAASLLAHPHVPLRRLRELSEWELRELFLEPGRLTRIRELGIDLHSKPLMRPLPGPPGEVLEKLEGLPDLHTLFVGGDRARATSFLASSPLLDRLVTLGVSTWEHDHWDLDTLMDVVVASRGALRELVLKIDAYWRVTLRRTQPGPFTEVTAWWPQGSPQSSAQHLRTCMRLLHLIDREHVRSLEIQTGHRIRPDAYYFEKLTGLLAEMPLERCEVPWDQALPLATRANQRRWWFEIPGCDTLEHLELLWDAFGSEWNKMSVGGRAVAKFAKRSLAKHLAAQHVSLFRTGSTDLLDLERHACRGSLTLDHADVATWFAGVIDTLAPTGIASCGLFEPRAHLDLETYGECAPGSIFVLPPALAKGLAAAHLARLGARAIGSRGLAIGDSSDAVDKPRLAAFRRALITVLDDIRAASAPPWFAATVKAYVAPHAHRRGLTLTCDHPMRLAWSEELVVRLDDTTGPLRMAIKGVMGARGRFPASPAVVRSAEDVRAELDHHSYVFEGA